jgi:hypothetical protein
MVRWLSLLGVLLSVVPVAAQDCTVAPLGVRAVQLAWTTPEPAPNVRYTGYLVRQRRDEGAWETVATLGGTTLTLPPLPPGRYRWELLALRTKEDGTPLSPQQAEAGTMPPCVILPPPR